MSRTGQNKNHIVIEAEPHYIEAQSAPEQCRYVFAYTITLFNAGSATAQLLRRHWLITDGNGKMQEVSGDGVVGEQPYLKPGETFRYTSGAVLETPVGIMQGKYIMCNDDGEQFEAIIPRFRLAVPRAVH